MAYESRNFPQTAPTDEVKNFTNESHDSHELEYKPTQQKEEKTLRRAPVWCRPNTLRRLSQKYSHNSRVLERVNYAYLDL